ncbi:MAG: hypothetical protein HWE39_12470 [Oceanospirillaceae bacterium]|nr:hypothetical protein [Oceanospirillaceae bacterium]
MNFLKAVSFSGLLILAACGGSGSSSESDSVNIDGKCEFNLPSESDLMKIHYKVSVTEPGNSGLSIGDTIEWWYSETNGGEIKGKNSSNNTLRTAESYSYSVNGSKATLSLVQAGGTETFNFTATSPKGGTYTYNGETSSQSYNSAGTFTLPAYVATCGNITTSSEGVSAFNKSLTSSEKEIISNNRTIDEWLIEPFMSDTQAFAFSTNNESTIILGEFQDGVVTNEISYAASEMPITVFQDSTTANGFTGQYLPPQTLSNVSEGGWIYDYHYIDGSNNVTNYDSSAGSMSTSKLDYVLSNGTFVGFENGIVLFDKNLNEVCDSKDLGYNFNDRYLTPYYLSPHNGNYPYSQHYAPIHSSLVEEKDGLFYTAIRDPQSKTIELAKWNTSCEQLWNTSISINYGTLNSPLVTVFKLTGNHLYIGYTDSTTSIAPVTGQYVFSRLNKNTGDHSEINSFTYQTLNDFGLIYDVEEDSFGNIYLAHVDAIQKLSASDLSSEWAYQIKDAPKPLIPLKINDLGDLEIAYSLVISKENL